MWNEIQEAWRYRSVVQNFVRTSLAVRYRRSVLGYLWSVLSPLLKYAIMGIVFEIIGRFNMTNYFGFMFVGSVFFGFVSTVIQNSTIAFISNENYIKKIYVPKLIFVLNNVFVEAVNFLLILTAIIVLLLLMGQVTVGWSWLFLPVAMLPVLFFLIGVSALFAVATLYFRDLQHLTEILFQALFFATPIFYPALTLQKDPILSVVLMLNPIYYFVALVREPLVSNTVPDATTMVVCVILASLAFFAGLFTVQKFNNRIIFKL